MVICVPNKGSEQHSSTTRVWNFASECRAVGSISLDSTLVSINIAALRRGPVKGKRRCWLRLGVEVGLDITFTVSWRPNGHKVQDDIDLCCSKLTLESLNLPNDGLVNEFRAPVQKRESSNSNISNDTLPGHLEQLRAAAEDKNRSQNALLNPSCSDEEASHRLYERPNSKSLLQKLISHDHCMTLTRRATYSSSHYKKPVQRRRQLRLQEGIL